MKKLKRAEARAGGVVLLDIDGVIESGPKHSRPGMVLLCDTLTLLGFEVVAWSSGGAEHALKAVERCGLHGSIHRFLSKPDYPMTKASVLERVGQRPALQIDDDATERIGDWPFMLLETFRPPPKDGILDELEDTIASLLTLVTAAQNVPDYVDVTAGEGARIRASIPGTPALREALRALGRTKV